MVLLEGVHSTWRGLLQVWPMDDAIVGLELHWKLRGRVVWVVCSFCCSWLIRALRPKFFGVSPAHSTCPTTSFSVYPCFVLVIVPTAPDRLTVKVDLRLCTHDIW